MLIGRNIIPIAIFAYMVKNKTIKIALPIILAFTMLFNAEFAFSQKESIKDQLLTIKSLLDQEKIEQAKLATKSLEKKIELWRENDETAIYYEIKASTALHEERLGEQQEYLLLFLNAAKKIENHDLLASAFLGFASHFEHIGDLKNAIPYFLKALDEYELINNAQKIAYLYNKIGLIYYSDKNYIKARSYFFSAYSIYKKYDREDPECAYWVQNSLSNISLTYLQTKDFGKALAYSKKALLYCQESIIDNERPMAVLNSNIGSIYGRMGNYALAEKYLREGIETSLEPKNHETLHAIYSKITLINFLTKQKKFALAEVELGIVWSLINSGKNFEEAKSSYYKQLAELKFAKQDYKNAFEAQKLYMAIEDSIDKITENRNYSKEILIHDLENQKTLNDLLRSENNYKGLTNKVVITMVVLAILLTVLAFIGQAKLRQKNKLLSDFNLKINEQKNATEVLNLELIKVNKNKSFLIQSVAHDLRTPIGNVMNLNDFLSETDLKEQEAADYIKLIRSSCLLALNIMEDILDESMIDNGKLQLNKRHGNIKHLIQESIHLLQFRAKPKHISILFEQSSDLELKFDHERIKRVLMNILMNAIKFSPRGCNIYINQLIDGNYCKISIRDEGIGMGKDLIGQIFERNTPSGRVGLEMERSIGIGLAITQSIVESHGGKINVESTPNSGSTFYIELPLS